MEKHRSDVPRDGSGSNPPSPTTFYAEVWSSGANLIKACYSQSELDEIVSQLKALYCNESDGQDPIIPEPWFVIDYNPG